MNTGERISQRGGTISEYGEAWTAGQKNVRQGEQMIDRSSTSADRARKQLSDARAQVARAEQRLRDAETGKNDGQRLVSDGTYQMQRAEADYAVIRAGPSANPAAPRK
jgi:chromosome segregation ATPase